MAPSVPSTSRDMGWWLVVGLVVGLSVAAVTGIVRADAAGLRDVDQVVYLQTLEAMRSGDGYYDAMTSALMTKEGVGPSAVRAVRPPLLYVALGSVPAGLVTPLVAVAVACSLGVAARLGAPFGRAGAPVAVIGVGCWLVAGAPLLSLHAEFWGIPFLLAGVWAEREGRSGWAALALMTAAATRELFIVAFVVALLGHRRERSWRIAGAGLVAYYLVHVFLATQVLVAGGRQPGLGNSLDVALALSAVSPSGDTVGWVIGATAGLLGVIGLLTVARGQRGAMLVAIQTAVVLPLAVMVGRQYWGLAAGPALACYAGAGIEAMRRRVPARWSLGSVTT